MPYRRLLAAAFVLPLALALAACLFVPGKFDSTLIVRADRSFEYSYKGEVRAIDLSATMAKAMSGMGDSEDGDADAKPEAEASPSPEEVAKKDAEYREIAAKLREEAGYRSVEYRGEGVFMVDYAIRGTLTHNFVFPFNRETGMAFPWIAVELRGKDGVRVEAPAFAKAEGDAQAMSSGNENAFLDGTLTLITDAQVVSQNGEATAAPAGQKAFRWKVSPQTEAAPSAVLKLAGL